MRALLEPRSVAVIGASSDPWKAGGRPILYLKQLQFNGNVYPINPGRTEIGGLRSYPSLASVGAPIDLCVISVPTELVESALQECADANVPAAVIFTSGFSEVGAEGKARQDRLTKIAQVHGMAVCGPNCVGIINVASGAAATFTSAIERRLEIPSGNVAFISQSGAIAAHILAAMQDQGRGLRHFVTTGNEAVLGFADYAHFLLDDPEIRVIAGYIEGIDGSGLVGLADAARERRKPLVLMKVGASAAGAKASMAHTGKLTGNDAVFNAAFRQLGIIRAHTPEELQDFAETLAACPLPKGPRVGVVSVSGGAAILMADWCQTEGLDVVTLAPETNTRLLEVLPWFATPANPVDTTGRPLWDEGMLQATLAAVADDPGVDMLLIHVGLAPGPGKRIADEIAAVASHSNKPFLVAWLQESDPYGHAVLRAAGIPIFTDQVRLVRSAAVLLQYARFINAEPSGQPPVVAVGNLPPLPQIPVVSEHIAKVFLQAAGISGPKESLANSPDEAVALADATGYPVCLKVVSPDIPHRTELGAVRLGIKSSTDVRTAYAEILATCRTAVPSAQIDGILVQEMVQGGVELIVSGFRDSSLGPVIMCGIGGVLVEVLKDTAMRLAPISSTEAESMLGQLRGAALLRGVRGSAACDIAAAAEAIARLSVVIAETDESIDTIEINPLVVLPEGRGVRMLDALITRREPKVVS